MSDVFLSYSSRYQKHAERLAKQLESIGSSVWLASKNLRDGAPVEEEITRAIRDARAIVFLVGNTPPSSEWVQREYMMALEHSWSDEGKILLPVLIGDAEPPSFLRHVAALRVNGRNPDWARAAKEIARLPSPGHSGKRSVAPIKEQVKRLNLIERGANALRVAEREMDSKKVL